MEYTTSQKIWRGYDLLDDNKRFCVFFVFVSLPFALMCCHPLSFIIGSVFYGLILVWRKITINNLDLQNDD